MPNERPTLPCINRNRSLENDLTNLIALPRLTGASSTEIHEQAEARRMLSLRLLNALRAARTPREALAALRLHDGELEQLGRHDDAARLRALTRAVDADFAQMEREVVELQARVDHSGGRGERYGQETSENVERAEADLPASDGQRL